MADPDLPGSDFPAEAGALRARLSLLSHRTYTTERRLVMELIIELSLDARCREAALPDQARIAELTGLSRGDVCRAEADLRALGLIKVRRGADGCRLYAAQTDAAGWTGKNLGWRIADPAARVRALEARADLAAAARARARRGETAGGDPRQMRLGFVVAPTPGEAFTEALDESAREVALASWPAPADALPPSSSEPAPLAPLDPASPLALLRASVGLPPRPRPIGCPANRGEGEPSSQLAGQPIGDSPELAVQPIAGSGPGIPPGPKLAAQPTGLAVQPIAGNDQLAARPIAGPRPVNNPVPTNARERAGGIDYQLPSTPPVSTTSVQSRGVVAGGRGEPRAEGRGPDPEEAAAVRQVVGEVTWAGWVRWWQRELGRHRGKGWLALGDLKIQQDLIRCGTRKKPISNPGAWLTGAFCKLAGIERPRRQQGQIGNSR